MEKFVRILICILGLTLSIYAYYVEHAKQLDSEYEALCDVSGSISCSAVFTSEYGKGFGIVQHILGKNHYLNLPNSIFGMAFYLIQMTGAIFNNRIVADLLYLITFVGIFMCIYLAYILTFILHDFCVVCVSTYALSFILHYLNFRVRKKFKTLSKKSD